MDTAWPMLLFLAALMGSGMLILICGIQSHEDEAEDLAGKSTESPLARDRSFFATLESAFASPRARDEDVVHDVEQHMRRQSEVVARFVERPSIDRLHNSDIPQPEPEMSLFCTIQKYLELERQLAEQFVSDPTLDRLHGRCARAM